MEQPESLSYILGSLLRQKKMNSEKENIKKLYQMVCASEFKINLPETVIPGSDSYFGYNKELEREPCHCLDLDKGSESSPSISIFLSEMWNPTLCSLPKRLCPHRPVLTLFATTGFGHFFTFAEWKQAHLPLCFSSAVQTPCTLLCLWSVTPDVLSGIPYRLSCLVMDSLPQRSSHSCVSCERTELLAVHEAEENQHKSQS